MIILQTQINGGIEYTYIDGTTVWSREPMSDSELVEHKRMVDQMFCEENDPEDYEPYYTLGAPRMAW